MAEEQPVPCRGSEDRMCLCDMCLHHKLTLLQEAQPSVQQQILQHLPALQSASIPHVANPPPPRSPPPPPRQTSAPPRQNGHHHQANPNLHQMFSSSSPPPPRSPPRSPPHQSSATPRAPSSSQSQHPGPASLGDLLNSSPPLHLGNQSLFSIPLFPNNMDADMDTVSSHPDREAMEPEDIVIPPVVRERIPNILTYIKYTLDSTKITSDVKKAAMVESIEEVLAICDKIFRKGDNPTTMP
ncbi:hypothetical protein L7F22_058114 [Adiantum nelumboides]|nr:hypothetical protein [Adiantum nelumboides]